METRRREDDVLTNNLDIPYAEQCRDCKFRDRVQLKGDLMAPHKKNYCDIYKCKPLDIINNRMECAFYKKEL